MNKAIKVTVLVLGVLLVLNGVLNIIDDSRVLTYDITTILAGLGFILLSQWKNK
ncbi:MAG: hypothetical protein HKP60_02490 [Eudoraea sp.]|nr:hypothetical protein [Eudoraea sp.]NNJ39720.1 hypothetical protein [Eudoraea sp.]